MTIYASQVKNSIATHASYVSPFRIHILLGVGASIQNRGACIFSSGGSVLFLVFMRFYICLSQSSTDVWHRSAFPNESVVVVYHPGGPWEFLKDKRVVQHSCLVSSASLQATIFVTPRSMHILEKPLKQNSKKNICPQLVAKKKRIASATSTRYQT